MNAWNTTNGSANDTPVELRADLDKPPGLARPSTPTASSESPTDEDRLADSDDFAGAKSEPTNDDEEAAGRIDRSEG